jgi:hypothetical protein
MSWSVNIVGKPAEVTAAITATASTTEGQSGKELTAALPALVSAVLAYPDLIVTVAASGHGTINAAGNIIYATVNMTVAHNLK